MKNTTNFVERVKSRGVFFQKIPIVNLAGIQHLLQTTHRNVNLNQCSLLLSYTYKYTEIDKTTQNAKLCIATQVQILVLYPWLD